MTKLNMHEWLIEMHDNKPKLIKNAWEIKIKLLEGTKNAWEIMKIESREGASSYMGV
jgi:hypothetical protein